MEVIAQILSNPLPGIKSIVTFGNYFKFKVKYKKDFSGNKYQELVSYIEDKKQSLIKYFTNKTKR